MTRAQSLKVVGAAAFVIGLAVLVAVAWRLYMKEAIRAHTCFCLNNLGQIATAKFQFAADHKLQSDAVLTPEQVASYVQGGLKGIHMRCPSGGQYTIGKTIEDEARCSVHGSRSQHIYAY